MSAAKLRTLPKKLDTRFHGYERGVGGLGDPKKHPNLNNNSSPNSAHTCACRYPPQRFVFCTDSPKIDPCIRRGERGVWGFGKIKYFYLSVSIPPLSAHSRAGGNPSWISNWIPAVAGMSGVLGGFPLCRSYRRPLGSALGVRKSVSIVSATPNRKVYPVFQRDEWGVRGIINLFTVSDYV